MANEDGECVTEGSAVPSRCINGLVTTSMDKEASTVPKMVEEKSESQRQNVIALVVIFVSSLLVMAVLFYNIPELDE